MEIAFREKVTLPAVLFRSKQIQNDRSTSFSRINHALAMHWQNNCTVLIES